VKKIKFLLPVLILVGSIGSSVSFSFGKAEYTKKEKKACTYCHVKANSKQLNDLGKCYKAKNHSLEGCETKSEEKK
jgi:hypothetical protein